jgi:ferrochelatase
MPSRFAPEPRFRHDQSARTGILLCNLGTPAAPTAAVRPYLAEFLGDDRVVEIPKLAWWPILHGIILRTRPAKSAAKYATVWHEKDGSPLLHWTTRQATCCAAGWASAATMCWCCRPCATARRPLRPSWMHSRKTA